MPLTLAVGAQPALWLESQYDVTHKRGVAVGQSSNSSSQGMIPHG